MLLSFYAPTNRTTCALTTLLPRAQVTCCNSCLWRWNLVWRSHHHHRHHHHYKNRNIQSIVEQSKVEHYQLGQNLQSYIANITTYQQILFLIPVLTKPVKGYGHKNVLGSPRLAKIWHGRKKGGGGGVIVIGLKIIGRQTNVYVWI